MKLYNDSDPAPNPRRVRIFMLEKGIDVPLVHVPLAEGKHKTPEFLAKNSLGQLPVLELDDGSMLSESVSICRYLEALHPEPPLFGRGPAESARVDMWIRRIELRVMLPAGMVWVHCHPFTAAYAAAQGRRVSLARRRDRGPRVRRRRPLLDGRHRPADDVRLRRRDRNRSARGVQEPEGLVRACVRPAERGAGSLEVPGPTRAQRPGSLGEGSVDQSDSPPAPRRRLLTRRVRLRFVGIRRALGLHLFGSRGAARSASVAASGVRPSTGPPSAGSGPRRAPARRVSE